jgi:predicted sugar kinase
MSVSITSPACLPLGILQAEGRPALLAVTLQYPPIRMLVKPHNELTVTGARAAIAREQAGRWFAHHDLPLKAEIEIELGIPAHMGLGSEALMAMSVVRGLQDLTGVQDLEGADSVGLGPEFALEAWCHARGGLVVAGTDGTLIRRHAIAHDDSNAWVFVQHLPLAHRDTPPSFERARRRALLNAAQYATTDVEPLWRALVGDDFTSFAQTLMGIQANTYEALAKAGTPMDPAEDVRDMLETIGTSGAAAWGQSLGGLAAWGLIRGAGPSQIARTRMRRLARYDGGTVTAALVDNQGAVLAPA